MTITPFNQSTIFISWSPPVVSFQNGVIRNYTINVINNETGGSEFFVVNNNKTTLIVNNLKPFSVYFISVAASTVGVGPFTAFVSVTLPEGG